MIYDLQKDILEATKYVSGFVNNEDKYVISASMVANDPLQNYLSIIHGKIDGNKIDDTHLGSVFHKGMEEIMGAKVGETSYVYAVEHSMHKELSNGWILSGTADLILEPTPGNFEIRDYKLTKNYAHKMFLKEKYTHSYTKQLQVLESLFREGENRSANLINNVTLVCDYFIKDAKAIEYEKSYRPEEVPNKEGTEDIRAAEVTLMEVVAITDTLQSYIESATIPPECKDLWIRNVKGNIIRTRCQLYCSYNSVCPYYDNNTHQAANRIASW